MGRRFTVAEAAHALEQGGVLAYPTEAVFGLGCDPLNEAAVRRLLAIKQRSWEKGLILVASCYGQLLRYVDDGALSEAQRQRVLARWPGPVTWVMPAKESVPDWLTGQFDSIAVRVSDHTIVKSLCSAFGGPLVSTSANLSGEEPARTMAQVERDLGQLVDGVVLGEVGGNPSPSTILDARSGQVLR
ncbi:L-threonylcarbamoyladenylate synthase [Ferrimonas gelatinilytica]|uniref:Threonylcarbamoyl-AMP synthase n=1 Tax=Ferrimonas gelatinilytica TaxID=1255257 RepID=A0ABP9SEV1_9GAMM